MQPEGKPNPDRIAQLLQNLFRFINFYDQVDFSLEQRLSIIKAIIELTDPSGSPSLAENRSIGAKVLKIMLWCFMIMIGGTFLAITTVLSVS